MGGTTANGVPYVTPDDHPKEFPAHSQALANKIEAGLVKAGSTAITCDGFGTATLPIPAGFRLVSATVYFDSGHWCVIRTDAMVGVWSTAGRAAGLSTNIRWVAAKF